MRSVEAFTPRVEKTFHHANISHGYVVKGENMWYFKNCGDSFVK